MKSTSTWKVPAVALAVLLLLAVAWRLSLSIRKRQTARAQAERALGHEREREEGPASADIGCVRKRDEQPEALRALSKLLKAYPRAASATIVWLPRGRSRYAPRSAMSYNRAQRLLHITWAEGNQQLITVDEAGIHHFAAIGRIDQV